MFEGEASCLLELRWSIEINSKQLASWTSQQVKEAFILIYFNMYLNCVVLFGYTLVSFSFVSRECEFVFGG